MASHGVPRVSGAEAKTEQNKKRELEKIAQYKELVDLVNTKVAEKQYTVEVLSLTSKLLTQNPEYYTIWNHRRRILQQLTIEQKGLDKGDASQQNNPAIYSLIVDDLKFLIPLLIQYPKCYWIWDHRLWLLQQAASRLPTATSHKLWQEELGLVNKMLMRDSRNFLGWDYRRLVVGQLESFPAAENGEKEAENVRSSMVEHEFEYTTKMVKTNLSNFSAWHNRSKLIPRLLNERGADDTARRDLLYSEFTLVTDAISMDPYDQSLWFYHQFLMSTLSPSNSREAAIVTTLTNHDRIFYYEKQISLIKEILEDTDDCKWLYQALLMYAAEYLEIEGGNRTFTTQSMRAWLAELRRLDPLRARRWDDLERALGV